MSKARANLAGMAWRNLWRNRRRTLVTLSGITFGVLLATVFTGMGDASYTNMINLAARMGGGHVTIQHPEFQDTPSLKRTIDHVSANVAVAQSTPNVRRATVRITGNAMLATARENTGAFFIAFDPTDEDTTTLSVLEALSAGQMFSSARDKGVILGEKLAENLGLTLGKKVVYTVTDKQGEIISELVRVVGLVRTGAQSLDQRLCLFPIDTMRRTLGYAADEATLVAVFIDDQRKSDAVRNHLSPGLKGEAAAMIWSETQAELAGFISMKETGTLFFELIIMILVAAGIFNTMFVSVMERIREFGIMMAIGFSPGKLFKLVMWESAWMGVCGIVFAVAMTAWPYYYLNKNGIDMSAMTGTSTEVAGVAVEPVFYVGIYPENAVAILGIVLLATLASGLYPAWRAGRVAPVESINLV